MFLKRTRKVGAAAMAGQAGGRCSCRILVLKLPVGAGGRWCVGISRPEEAGPRGSEDVVSHRHGALRRGNGAHAPG